MDKEGVDQIRHFVEWLDAGAQQAGPLADELLALPVERWSEWLGAHPEALTVHVFDELLRAAQGDIEHALASTEILIRHVDAVTPPPEAAMTRAYIRGNTWRVHGDALRAAGDLHGALDAYERAAGIFRAEPALPPEEILFDTRPPTEAEIRRAKELAEKHDWDGAIERAKKR